MVMVTVMVTVMVGVRLRVRLRLRVSHMTQVSHFPILHLWRCE